MCSRRHMDIQHAPLGKRFRENQAKAAQRGSARTAFAEQQQAVPLLIPARQAQDVGENAAVHRAVRVALARRAGDYEIQERRQVVFCVAADRHLSTSAGGRWRQLSSALEFRKTGWLRQQSRAHGPPVIASAAWQARCRHADRIYNPERPEYTTLPGGDRGAVPGTPGGGVRPAI